MGAAMMGTGVARGDNRAREAAEMAIRSPLLEDVNLQGARGILVNITAGLDLSLGEFSEVGDTIEEFASENATVVVGTVIDPEMRDELKVTVVATGLGASAAVQETAFKVVETKKPAVEQPANVTYRDLDRPTVMRNQQAAVAREVAAKPSPLAEKDMEYLDIPAFLRRQAD
jgi:cell division protein FtsZ